MKNGFGVMMDDVIAAGHHPDHRRIQAFLPPSDGRRPARTVASLGSAFLQRRPLIATAESCT
ncbi:MAG: hypothetical protein IPN05_12295 [Sulfuritalea sp.]|nr:hypothetical protein [Sulfuritalea sp.]